MSSKHKRTRDDEDNSISSKPPIKKAKLDIDAEDANKGKSEEVEQENDEQSESHSEGKDACDRFHDMLSTHSAEELLDPLCGGSHPETHDLAVIQETLDLLGNISRELRRRQSYIYQQRTLRRDKLLDSFISITDIDWHKEPHYEYSDGDDNDCDYRCNVQIGQQATTFFADWYSGEVIYGHFVFHDVLQYGSLSSANEEKMHFFNVTNAIKLRRSCKDIDALTLFVEEDESDFDWIVGVLAISMEVISRIDAGNWMTGCFGPSEYVPGVLNEWKETHCVTQKKRYTAIINHWFRTQSIGVVPSYVEQIMKCYACTNFGVCCGVLKNESVIGADFI